jgi:hypothetical protein
MRPTAALGISWTFPFWLRLKTANLLLQSTLDFQKLPARVGRLRQLVGEFS